MKIIIDASHGGEDSGYTGNGIVEKDFSLLISNYIKDKLKNRDYEVVLTRTSDETLSDEERIDRIRNNINNNEEVLIVSNRLNQGGNDGAEIIYPLRESNELAKDISINLEKVGQNVNKYYQRRLPSDLSLDYDYLIRNTNPYNSIIIEYGYIDSKGDDVSFIKNNYKLLGDAVVLAIDEYLTKSNTYTVKSGDTLYSIAKKYNTTVNELKDLNNLTSSSLNIGQVLKVPTIKTSELPSVSTENLYKVQAGDTLYGIAKKYNVSVSDIKSENNLTSNLLSVGQILKIPEAGSSYETYTVKSGDNLYSIANRYNTTVNEIKELNNLSSNLLSIGQILKIPKSNKEVTYTVKKGDNLYSIAKKYNTTVTKIKELNNLSSNLLSIGQVLKIS